jgi:uncharacterized protein
MNCFRLSRFLILVPVFAALMPGAAAAGFDCAGKDADQFKTICHDAEIMGLDRAVDASLARAQHAVDPVTAMLLRRDQNWVMEIAGGAYAQFNGADDPRRQGIIAVLQQRLAMLDHMASRADGIAGEWLNALGAATIAAGGPNGVFHIDRSQPISSKAMTVGCPARRPRLPTTRSRRRSRRMRDSRCAPGCRPTRCAS